MSKTPRILLWSDAPIYGGAERYLVELAAGLRQRCAVEAVVAWGGGADGFAAELESLAIPVRRLAPIATLSDRVAFLKAAKHVALRRPDLLHFNLSDPRACNGAMVAAATVNMRPFVTTEHLPHAPFDTKPLPLRNRVAARRTALTIVNTSFARDAVQQRPHHRGRVAVVANGIRDPGAPTEAKRREARARLGFSDHEGPLLLWIGRMIPQKNPDLLLEGLRRVVTLHPSLRCAMIGDGPLLEATQRSARELRLTPQVRFYGHRPDARDLVYGADLFVSTSRFEGMPFTVLEAQFAGVPVVAPKIPGIVELVADPVSGWLVAGEDGDALGGALAAALDDAAGRRQRGLIARERATTLFGFQGMADRTWSLYEPLLG